MSARMSRPKRPAPWQPSAAHHCRPLPTPSSIPVRPSAGWPSMPGGDPAVLVPALAQLTQDKNSAVRSTAVLLLGYQGALALPHLTSALKHGDPQVHSAAVQALARLGKEARQAVPALVELYERDKA